MDTGTPPPPPPLPPTPGAAGAFVAERRLSTGAKVAIGAAVLAVGVFVVGLLAAIAIPSFLNQRERAWESEAVSALRNSALDMESTFTANGRYPFELPPATFPVPPNVDLQLVTTERFDFCLEVRHDGLPGYVQHYQASGGGISLPGEPCP